MYRSAPHRLAPTRAARRVRRAPGPADMSPAGARAAYAYARRTRVARNGQGPRLSRRSPAARRSQLFAALLPERAPPPVGPPWRETRSPDADRGGLRPVHTQGAARQRILDARLDVAHRALLLPSMPHHPASVWLVPYHMITQARFLGSCCFRARAPINPAHLPRHATYTHTHKHTLSRPSALAPRARLRGPGNIPFVTPLHRTMLSIITKDTTKGKENRECTTPAAALAGGRRLKSSPCAGGTRSTPSPRFPRSSP